jgi:hypothetical protein
MKAFLKPAVFTLLLLLASCNIENLSDGTIIFYNFSPAAITGLKVYDSSLEGAGHGTYTKKDIVYTYTGAIKTADYHIFVLPKYIEYFFEVTTEEGEIYEGGPFGSYGEVNIIFSVDYDVLEYNK